MMMIIIFAVISKVRIYIIFIILQQMISQQNSYEIYIYINMWKTQLSSRRVVIQLLMPLLSHEDGNLALNYKQKNTVVRTGWPGVFNTLKRVKYDIT